MICVADSLALHSLIPYLTYVLSDTSFRISPTFFPIHLPLEPSVCPYLTPEGIMNQVTQSTNKKEVLSATGKNVSSPTLYRSVSRPRRRNRPMFLREYKAAVPSEGIQITAVLLLSMIRYVRHKLSDYPTRDNPRSRAQQFRCPASAWSMSGRWPCHAKTT